MLTDEEIKAGATLFARTLKVVGGRTSFDYAVRAHLLWFEALMERGLGWNGIVRVLTAAGVTRDDGRVLSRGHISAVYWRQMHAERPATPVVVRPERRTIEGSHPSRSQDLVATGSVRAVLDEPHVPASFVSVAGPINDQASDRPGQAQATTSDDVRNYMRRALASQRSNDDDI